MATPTWADEIRRRFTERRKTLRELFDRIVFNKLTGNTDDHPATMPRSGMAQI